MATAQHFAILDNNVLDSSMGSTQGLLSFMTNASRQIKTYLGPESNPKLQRRQRLLKQLSQIKTHNLLPDILKQPNFRVPNTAPSSPTPSLDSVGSLEDDDRSCSGFRSSCILNSHTRKRSHAQLNEEYSFKRTKYIANTIDESALEYDLNNIIPTINTSTYNVNNNMTTYGQQHTTMTPNNSNPNPKAVNSYDDIIPSPLPDFDDLVDCMLTEDSLSNIDVNNYFPQL